MWNKGLRFTIQRILVSAVAIACLIPGGYLLLGSLRVWGSASLAQYEEILLYTKEFFAWFWNSVCYTAGILVLCVPVAVLAAYGLSQHRFPGRSALLFLYTLLMLLPFQATVVAQYLTLRTLGLLDTRPAIILPFAFGAFGAFLLTQFMRGLDPEILEAARLDGADWAKILVHIICPLCKPAIVSLVALQSISCWSMVDQPVVFLRSEVLLPLSQKLSGQTFGASAFAAGILYAVVPMLIYLSCQKALEEGIGLTSIK